MSKSSVIKDINLNLFVVRIVLKEHQEQPKLFFAFDSIIEDLLFFFLYQYER